MSPRKSKIQENYEAEVAQGKGQGKCRLQCDSDLEPWWVFAEEREKSERRALRPCMPMRIRLCYPIRRRYENGHTAIIPWTVENLTEFLQRTLRHIRNAYAGEWVLAFTVPQPCKIPLDRPHVKAPPLPQMQGVPQEPKPRTAATRAELDAMNPAINPLLDPNAPWEAG